MNNSNNFFSDLFNHLANANLSDTKMFTIGQAMNMMKSARALEREAIERNFHLVPKNEAIQKINDGMVRAIDKVVNEKKEGIVCRQPFDLKIAKGRTAPQKYVVGDKESVFGVRPVKHQWNEKEAISKENIENAITILLNRGQSCVTVRDIVDVIKQFVPAAFDASRKMVVYRHKLTKKFLSSDKKLLGRLKGRMIKGQYFFDVK